MPVARIRTPDGRVMRIQANSPEEAMKLAQQTLAANTDATNRQKSVPNWERALAQGITLGSSDEMDAGLAKLQTRLNPKAQYTPQQAYDAVMQTQRSAGKQFSQEHPVVSGALNIGGGLAGLLAGGGELAGLVKGGSKAVAAIPGVGGLLASKGLLPASVRAAAGGGLLGGITGGMSADPGQRMQGAQSGAEAGAVMGGLAPTAGAVLRPVGKVASRVANNLTGGQFNNVANAVSLATGGSGVTAQQTGLARIIDAMKKDGLTPDQVRNATNEWLRVGGASPAFMDAVRASPSGGETTFGLIRSSALKGGPARSTAIKYSDKVAGDLQGTAIDRTRQLAGNPQSPSVVRDQLEQTRSQTAAEKYPGPYAEPVKITPEIAQALQDQEGRAAIDRATAGARGLQDYPAVGDLDTLRMAADNPTPARVLPPTTGRALDRIQQAYGATGRGLMQREGAGDLAAGQFQRQAQINEALDQVPGLGDARANYKADTRNLQALDLGQGADKAVGQPFTNPREYTERLEALNQPVQGSTQTFQPAAQQMAGTGLSDEIVRNIGNPSEASTGYLNRLSTGTNPRQVLDATFGQQPAQDYQQSVGNMVDQMRNAHAINPDMGSKTAVNLVDMGNQQEIPLSKIGLLKAAGNALRSLSAPTDAERNAIVQAGTSSAQDTQADLLKQLEQRLHERFGIAAPLGLASSEQGARQ